MNALIPSGCLCCRPASDGTGKTKGEENRKAFEEWNKRWALEMSNLERAFNCYSRDALFRRVTFSSYKRHDSIQLADNGLFNTLIKHGDYKTYNVVCAFCPFEYNSGKYPGEELNALKVKYTHAMQHPACFMTWPGSLDRGGNLAFTDVYDYLKLTDLKYKILDHEGNWQGGPLYLNTMPKLQDDGGRLECSICLVRTRNVLTSCNHCVICSVCLLNPKNKMRHKCCYCRTMFDFYTDIHFPDQPSLSLLNNMIGMIIPDTDTDFSGGEDSEDSF